MALLMEMIKWSILAGVVTLLVILLKPVLDRRYRVKWRYWLWLVLAAVLVLAPVPWGALLPEGKAPAIQTPVTIEVPQTTIVMEQDRVTLAPQEELEELITVQPPLASAAAGKPSKAEQPETTLLPLDTVLTAIWLTGASALLLWRLSGNWLFYRKVRRWSRRPQAETLAMCAGIRQELGIRWDIPLVVCPAVDSPMAAGLLLPRLLLPREDYSPQELTFILRHELTHIRRRDLWYKLLLLLAQTIHWFNPLVWVMARQAEADIELTCDDVVMTGRSHAERRDYSETLLASLHNSKGTARAALSTHFYGGAEVMKERFRNILGGGQRRWGGVILTALLLAVAVVGCAVGISAAAVEPLSEEELAQWQEKLSDTTYNGFLASLYSDASRLSVGQVFYNGAGVSHEMTDAEREAVLEAMGGDPDCPIVAVTAQAADDFLRENTGLGLDHIAGGFGSMWIYLPEYDSYYLAHGDTNYVFVTVTGGARRGDTIELTIEQSDGAPGTTDRILTITDGKIKSYTNPLYTAVETMAWQLMNDQAEAYESAQADGPSFADRYISDLWCAGSYKYNTAGIRYSVWSVGYRLLPEDVSKVTLAGGMELENGWLTEASSMGSPVLIVSMDEKGNITLEEQTWAYDLQRDDGFTWEEYIYCKLHLGMELTYSLGGWPELTTPFIMDLLDGRSTWATDRDSCVKAYAEEKIGSPVEISGRERTFSQNVNSDCDESLLLRCRTTTKEVRLLLRHINYFVPAKDTTVSFWQVCGEIWDDGGTQPTGFQEQPLYNTKADFGGGYTGTVYLNGWQGNDCGGISAVQVIWDNGDGTTFYTREAIAAQWGEDSRDYFTEASSYVENADGGYDFDGGLKLLDVNFDGYLDIGLQAWMEMGGNYDYFWLFDPESGTFRYGFCLQQAGADPETKEVTSAFTTDGISYESRYVWNESGSLVLARRFEEKDVGGGKMERTEYTAAEGIPLSTRERKQFSAMFSQYDLCNTPYNVLLRFPYEGPQDAGYYLDLLFYDQKAVEEKEDGRLCFVGISQEEEADLKAASVPIDFYDLFKMTREQAEKDLARLFGLTAEEAAELLEEAAVKPGPLYLEKYDAYYSVHSDTWWHEYAFTSGFFYADGTCVLDYTAPIVADSSQKSPEERDYNTDVPMRLTLRQEEGKWVAVSNLYRSE